MAVEAWIWVMAPSWVGHGLGFVILLGIALLITVTLCPMDTGFCISHFNFTEEKYCNTDVKN